MLCCTLAALIASQIGGLIGAAKVRLFGGSGAVQLAVAGHVGTWGRLRWMVLAAGLAVEMITAAAAFPALYALDVPARAAALGGWPICSVLLSAVVSSSQ